MANRSSTFRLIPRNPNAHYRSVNVDFSPVFLYLFDYLGAILEANLLLLHVTRMVTITPHCLLILIREYS